MPRLYRGYGKGFERFEHAIADSILSPGITLRELAMLEFVNQITDKPRWWEEVFDEVAIKAWRGECGSEEEQRYEATLLDRACFDYVSSDISFEWIRL